MNEAIPRAYSRVESAQYPEKNITDRLVKADRRSWKTIQKFSGRNVERPAIRDATHKQDVPVNAFLALFSKLCAEGTAQVIDNSPSSIRVTASDWSLQICMPAQIRRTNTSSINAESIASMGGDKLLSIRDIVGCEFCVAAEDGQKVYENIKKELAEGHKVSLSFQSVRNISSVFIFSAIGQLHNGEFSESDLKNNLDIIDISQERHKLIEKTAHRAKAYFENPSRLHAGSV